MFNGKPALLLSASPGGLGGLRGLNHLRDILLNLGAFPFNQQLAVPSAHEAFEEEGGFRDRLTHERLSQLIIEFGSYASKLQIKEAALR